MISTILSKVETVSLGPVGHRRHKLQPRIVDEDVDAVERRQRGGDLVPVRDVAHDRSDLPAMKAGEHPRRVLDFVVNGQDRDVRSGGNEAFRHAQPDAPARARYENPAAGEVESDRAGPGRPWHRHPIALAWSRIRSRT